MSSSLTYIAAPVCGMKVFAVPVDRNNIRVDIRVLSETHKVTGWAITDSTGGVICELTENQRRHLWGILIDPIEGELWNTHYGKGDTLSSYMRWTDTNGEVHDWYPPTAATTDYSLTIAECIKYDSQIHGMVITDVYEDAANQPEDATVPSAEDCHTVHTRYYTNRDTCTQREHMVFKAGELTNPVDVYVVTDEREARCW